MQPICQSEKAQQRMVSVESQPLFGPTVYWRLYCPVEGLLNEGKTKVADYKKNQPWPEGEFSEALGGTA